jgi:hypothetical protein
MNFGVVLKRVVAGVLLVLPVALNADAQDAKRPHRNGAIYFSWGYNTEWYTPSTVSVKQSSLGNDYKMVNVKAQDHRGWDEGIFNMALTIPQYNYRLGYYFNQKQDLAFEINFDHTKYIISDQVVNVQGTMGNAPVNDYVNFNQPNGFYYFLNNGANFLLFNIVKRVGLYHTQDRNFYLDFTGKAGIGPVIPHVQNMLYGKANNPGFQIGGWNTGLETALRATVMKYAYLEFSQKFDYARYSNLRVYEGRAKQAFGCYELILSAGVIIPRGKNNPLFTPVDKVNSDKH